MNKKLLRKKLALMLANLKKKRPFYTEVEYLESTETQYIDTGFALTANSTLDFNFSPNEQSTLNLWICGSYTTNSKLTGFRITNSTSLQGYIDSTSSISVSGSNVGKKYHCVMNSTNWSVNGTDGSSATQAAGRCNLTIFGWNVSPNTSAVSISGKCSAKVYNFKISDNGILVRDLIPVLDWDMTPCMYDKVSGELFYNQGTGNFVAGREIHYVDYLEGTGEQYIDTGYTPSGSTETEITTMLKDQTRSRFMFGCRSAQNSNTYACLVHSNNRIGYRVGSGFYLYSNGYNELNEKHTYKIANGVFYRDDVVVDATCEGASVSPNSTLALLTINTNNVFDTTQSFIGNLYSCIIKENNTLMRDFVPSIDQNGVGFMFDRVSHTIYDNAGTGAFSYPARELEYLESTGNQYIDTGYAANTNTIVEYNFNLVEVPTSSAFFGSGTSSTSTDRFQGYYESSLSFSTKLASTTTYSGVTLTAGTKHYSKMGIPLAGYYIDDTFIASATGTPTSLNLYVFARNINGSMQVPIKMKLYDFKISENNSLVRDFIPALQDGQAGMLDKVNNVFYSNAGIGTFSVGRILEPEYE